MITPALAMIKADAIEITVATIKAQIEAIPRFAQLRKTHMYCTGRPNIEADRERQAKSQD